MELLKMDMMLWNLILSGVIALVGWVLREKAAELGRITILLNRTREEITKEYVTKADVHHDINRIIDRLDRLDNKIDAFIREQKSALN